MWSLNNFKQESWAYKNNIFDDIECQKIIDYGLSKQLESGKVGNIDLSLPNLNIRNSNVSWFSNPNDEQENWIHTRCAEAVNYINGMFFRYDLTMVQDLQFTVYKDIEQQYYSKHIDVISHIGMPRKLSFSILLNSPEDYSGGELAFYYSSNPEVPVQPRGRGIFFPSHTLHEVTPVTKGTRYALVGWCVGPHLK
jgi:PKHD-type hydroxylase